MLCTDLAIGPDQSPRSVTTVVAVPRYEFRCRECTTTFEVDRPMSASSEPAACPAGHRDTVKLLSMAGLSRAGAGPSAPAGGCCGGGCGCG
jgi:putative FmdB family regulatory protein